MAEKFAVLLALSLTSAPPAPERLPVTIHLTPEQIRLCTTGNGCDLYHIDTLAGYIAGLVKKARSDCATGGV